MSVVQISRIQIRRGKKNDSGMPQLASGEMAWAVDSQELFIGNGSLTEGAPNIGNTKILTEHDSILDLVGQYRYRLNTTVSVNRSVQDRLDEGAVNARSFGVYPRGETAETSEVIEDRTLRLNAALSYLSENSLTDRAQLMLDAGEYEFNDSINIPSGCRLAGAGRDLTVLIFSNAASGIILGGPDVINNVEIRDLTIKADSLYKITESDPGEFTGMLLSEVKGSEFKNIKIIYPDGINTPPNDYSVAGIRLFESQFSDVSLNKNLFSNIEFQGLGIGVLALTSVSHNEFQHCLFKNSRVGAEFGTADLYVATNNTISHSTFDRIRRQAIIVSNGQRNMSQHNVFVNVGTDLTGTIPSTSIIEFRTPGNVSINDEFERSSLMSMSNLGVKYIPEISGNYTRESFDSEIINLVPATTPQLIARLALNQITEFTFKYLITGNDYTRGGTMAFVVNINDTAGQPVKILDEYDVNGAASDPDPIEFVALLTTQQDQKSVSLHYQNSSVNQFTLSYSYSIVGIDV